MCSLLGPPWLVLSPPAWLHHVNGRFLVRQPGALQPATRPDCPDPDTSLFDSCTMTGSPGVQSSRKMPSCHAKITATSVGRPISVVSECRRQVGLRRGVCLLLIWWSVEEKVKENVRMHLCLVCIEKLVNMENGSSGHEILNISS